MFRPAPQPEIFRAEEKDFHYIDILNGRFQDIANCLFGVVSSSVEEEIKAVSRILYYSITNLLTHRTLGEEYCDLVQVDSQGFNVKRRKRYLFVFLASFTPYLYRKFRSRANTIPGDGTLFTRLWNAIVRSIVSVDSDVLLRNLKDTHLVLFYLFGEYLNIWKRLSGIRYVYTNRLESPPLSYSVLGYLLGIQLLFRGYFLMKRANGRGRISGEEQRVFSMEDDRRLISRSYDRDSAPACSLCLCPRVNPTAVDCGHVFCWECIAGWVSKKLQCPLCRQKISCNNFVCLVYYL